MSYVTWMAMIGPDGEPDYHAYWRETDSLEATMIDVATYDDWFPDLARPIAAVQQCSKEEQFLPYAAADFI